MISTIFAKTKPINFVILLLGLFLLLVLHYFTGVYIPSFDSIIAALILAPLSALLVHFIATKNKHTAKNTYAIFCFVMLLGFFPEVFITPKYLIANTLLLIALRRLMQLRVLTGVSKKIFDACFCIILASYFVPLTLIYLFMVVVAILVYQPRNFRNWCIPFIAFFTWYSIYSVLRYVLHIPLQYSLDIDKILFFRAVPSSFFKQRLVLCAVFIVVAFVMYFLSHKKKTIQDQFSMLFIWGSLLLGLFLLLATSLPLTSVFLFSIFPCSVLLPQIIAMISKKWIKEFFFYLWIALPIAVLCLTFFKK